MSANAVCLTTRSGERAVLDIHNLTNRLLAMAVEEHGNVHTASARPSFEDCLMCIPPMRGLPHRAMLLFNNHRDSTMAAQVPLSEREARELEAFIESQRRIAA